MISLPSLSLGRPRKSIVTYFRVSQESLSSFLIQHINNLPIHNYSKLASNLIEWNFITSKAPVAVTGTMKKRNIKITNIIGDETIVLCCMVIYEWEGKTYLWLIVETI